MLPADPARRSVSIAGGQASYTDEGAGVAIVAVHGLPGSARDFRWLAPQVCDHARLVRLELPGFGATPVASGPDPSPIGRARFTLAACEALGLERPLLLGHSMGGVVACAAATLQPEAFRGLALLSSPGLRPHAMLRRLPVAAASRLLRRRWAARWLAGLQRRLFQWAGFRGYPGAELTRTIHCVAATSIAQHARRVRRLQLPTLVSWCDDDPLIEAELAEELAAACPAGPRLRFAQGGHNPQKSHAAEIGAALQAWLAEL